jgi:ribosomal protein S27AE
MPEADKMNCPDCGAEMNHHADKLVYESAPDDEDADEGGFILEAHACPGCGRSATRAAAHE